MYIYIYIYIYVCAGGDTFRFGGPLFIRPQSLCLANVVRNSNLGG